MTMAFCTPPAPRRHKVSPHDSSIVTDPLIECAMIKLKNDPASEEEEVAEPRRIMLSLDSTAAIPPPPSDIAAASSTTDRCRRRMNRFTSSKCPLSLLAVLALLGISSLEFTNAAATVVVIKPNLRGGTTTTTTTGGHSFTNTNDHTRKLDAEWEADDDDDDYDEEAELEEYVEELVEEVEDAASKFDPKLTEELDEVLDQIEEGGIDPTEILGEIYDIEEEIEIIPPAYWPEGCSYECYLDIYPDLANLTPGEALEQYMNNGKDEGRKCLCPDGAVAGNDSNNNNKNGNGNGVASESQAKEAEEEEKESNEVQELEEMLDEIEHFTKNEEEQEEFDELLEEIEFEGGAPQEEVLDEVAQAEAEAEMIIEQIEQDEEKEQQQEEVDDVADNKQTSANNENNANKEGGSEPKEVNQDNNKQTVMVEQTATEDNDKSSWPAGCSYECYLANYPQISSKTKEKALKNYYKHAEDRDCSCPTDTAEENAPEEKETAAEESIQGEGKNTGGENGDSNGNNSSKNPDEEPEDVLTELEGVEEAILELGMKQADGDGDTDEIEEEIEELQAEEEDLLEEALEENLLGDDEYGEFEDDEFFNEEEIELEVEELKEEVENLDEGIAAIENQDDPEITQEVKDAEVKDLLDWEEEFVDELEEDAQFSGDTTLNSTLEDIKEVIEGKESEFGDVAENIKIDPTLTMDLTTMNPPGLGKEGNVTVAKASEKGQAGSSELGDGDDDDDDDTVVTKPEDGDNSETVEDESKGDSDVKESESPTLNMDTEPERGPLNVTKPSSVVAGVVKEAESGKENMDTEPERPASNNATAATEGPAKTQTAPEEGDQAGNDDDDDDDDDNTAKEVAAAETTTSSPIEKAATSSPTQKATTASPTNTPEDDVPPTPNPTLAKTPAPTPLPVKQIVVTDPPTVQYIEPSEGTDPLANEKDKEGFANGEKRDDDDFEEPLPAAGGSGGSDDSTDDNFFRDSEEEAKKVGGWLTFASLILMIYTAYQMSENPDGICASLCRLVITVIGCIIKIIVIPFKYIMGGGLGGNGGHYMATPDYRDPYGSRHMELT